VNHNEQIIACALMLAADEPEYALLLDRLNKRCPESAIITSMVNARFAAVLKNDQEPDVLGEFLAAGGTYEQYDEVLKASGEIILTESSLSGAITRELNRGLAEKIRGRIHEYEKGQLRLEDLVATIIEEDTDDLPSMTLQAVIRLRDTHVEPLSVPTGFPILDRHLHGLPRGRMTILAARPGVGKSDLSLAMARNLLTSGKSVFLASLEMDKFEILRRMERGAGNVTALHQYPGRMEIDDRGDLSVPQIAAAVNMGRYDVVIVDHMQLLPLRQRHISQCEKITILSNQVRVAAKHSNAAWLVLSQLSRQARDENQMPQLSDLRDSGALEQDAYGVLFLHEPDKRDYTIGNRSVQLTIAKNRGGGGGHIMFRFTPRFSEWIEAE